MKQYGFIPSQIVLTGEKANHVLGDCNQPMKVNMPSGHGWGYYLPRKEPQEKNNVETYGCTIFGSWNCLETLGKFLFGPAFQSDFSDRFSCIEAQIGPFGANPHDSCESIRKTGGIAELLLPFSDDIQTREQYYSPNPPPQKLLAIARNFLTFWEIGHDWVFVGGDLESKRNRMKAALTMSPLAASGAAWYQHSDGKYYSDGPDNHWFEVFDFIEGDCWMVYDSYPDVAGEEIKKLSWDFNFGQCKRFVITRKSGAVGITQKIAGWISSFIGNIMR